MELHTLRSLLAPDGARLLGEVEREYDGGNALALASRLRQHHPGDLVAAALSQADLRRRAAAKLGADAGRMYFTAEALEQCTRRSVAEHRATRLAAAHTSSVLDLGCGIGGDLLAMVRRGITVTGVEQDPVRAAMARANLAALGLDAEVLTAAAEDVDRSPFEVTFADPSRRGDGRRVFDPSAYSPPWSFVTDLLTDTACVKVAPGIDHALVPPEVEAEWVSDAGEVKEAALWSGRLATAARRATLLPGRHVLTETDDPGTADVRAPQDFVYEPDGAVIRAGLVTAVAAIVGGGLVDRRIAYVTGPRAVTTPYAQGYRVQEVLPFREKPLRAALRARGIGTLTIKKRGVAITPEVLRKRLSLRGDAAATLILTRAAGHGTALLVDPLPPAT